MVLIRRLKRALGKRQSPATVKLVLILVMIAARGMSDGLKNGSGRRRTPWALIRRLGKSNCERQGRRDGL
jgi:hypothetical protein